MEFKVTELDEGDNSHAFNYEAGNYWENNASQTPVKKKKVTFTDILSNMNLVVNENGVLQYMRMNEPPTSQPSSHPSPQYQPPQRDTREIHYNYNYNYNPNEFETGPSTNANSQYNQQPIDPSVKHSYIYNKYFKDYNDPNAVKPGPRVPKTIQEYRQMILEDRIKAIQHKKRMEQIKSKKLLFTSVPGAQSNPRNMTASKNSLRSMNFR